jgi:hypothetical protein
MISHHHRAISSEAGVARQDIHTLVATRELPYAVNAAKQRGCRRSLRCSTHGGPSRIPTPQPEAETGLRA